MRSGRFGKKGYPGLPLAGNPVGAAEGTKRYVMRAVRCLFPALCVLFVLAALGCASKDTAFDEQPAPREATPGAPTAAEMESPIQRNGGAPVFVHKTQDPVIPETATVPNEMVYGDAFPGLNADLSQGPDITPAPAPAPAPTPEQRAAQEALEQRLAALEESLGELDARTAAPPKSGDADERLAAIETRLRDLSAQPQISPEQRETQQDLERRLQVLEENLKSAGAQPETSPEQRAELETIEQRLAALESHSGDRGAGPDLGAEQANLAQHLREMEVRLAAVEGKTPPPQLPAQEREDVSALSERVQTLEQRIAAAQGQPPQPQTDEQAAAVREQFEAQMRDMAARIAELEGKPAAPVETTPGNFEERFLAMEGRLSELEGVAYRAPEQATPASFDMAPVPDAASQEYLIGAGDLLDFTSFDDETLNRELTVRYDGYVSLPLIPDQKVEGATRARAEEMLRTAYAATFRDPQLSLIVREPLSKTFLVMGDVTTPARYPYTRATTLIEAITLAGGLRQRNTSSSTGGFIGITGQLAKAFVIRRVNGERKVFDYDLRHMGQSGSHASEAQIYYGDVIYVPEGVNLVYLLGESRNPVIVELTEGMTMLQMLALSGGFDTSTARLRSVVLLRQQNDDETRVMNMNVREMLKTGRDFPLQPGDIVYIPRRYLVRLEEFIGRITGSISPVLDLYTRAVDAYYIKDVTKQTLESDKQNNTLRILNDLESFGTSTSNLVDLFGRP